MRISPDELVFLDVQLGAVGTLHLNATIVFTWLVMLVLTACSWLVTRGEQSSPQARRRLAVLEVLVLGLKDQIRDVSQQEADPFLPFIGTLFLFIACANVLAVVPGYQPPTASLSTASALAGCVLVAVPAYGIAHRGLSGYLATYLRPTAVMLPFNIISELSRTIALAVRLYGNAMSGSVIVAILISVAPFFFPVLLQLLGLLTGLVQAYIFAVLATIYIASGTAEHAGASTRKNDN